jgi:Linalool dehydratase/isomerase
LPDDYTSAGLDRSQVGHLRHLANLARQPPNQWELMKGKGYGQEDFGGYRFQLAYAAYALALTHRHRLPAAPGLFKPIFERLIEKMLLPEVWMYWRDVSRGGSIFNAHLSAGYREEWDPVKSDNIMYSAYVQSMALLYHYLFGDDRYARQGALSFKFWSYFWGGQEKHFVYDENSLNDHIYWQMVQSGFLGVACEPNCIFQICNQPAILGFRLHDLVYGGNVAAEVTRSYEKAWQEFGRVGENGHYHIMMSQDTRAVRPNVAKVPWVDAWCGALMNMWNSEFVHAHYRHQIRDLIKPGPEGRLSVHMVPKPLVMGQTLITDDCDFGWVAAWASEMGDHETLQGMLSHADAYMSPKWRDGGFYYPRNDTIEDAQGNRTAIEPMSGNVLLGYARLNIPDGLHGLYSSVWDKARFAEPCLSFVADDIDVSRAVFDRNAHALQFRLQRNPAAAGDGTVRLSNMRSRGDWILRSDGDELARFAGGNLVIANDMLLARAGDDLVLHCREGSPREFTAAFART